MRLPFARLMELCAQLPEEDWNLAISVLSQRWGEPAARISDAIDAVQVMRGEETYLTVAGWL